MNYWLLSSVVSHKETGKYQAVNMAKQNSNQTTHKESIKIGKNAECDYQFTRKASLNKHQESGHMDKKYPCEECDYQATKKCHLSTHQQSVNMDKKYPCEECDYQGTLKSNLRKHKQSVHMGKK